MPVLQSARSRCARASRGTDPTIMSGAFERSCACDADRLEVISPYEIGASTQTASASTFSAGTSPMKPGLSLLAPSSCILLLRTVCATHSRPCLKGSVLAEPLKPQAKSETT